MSRGSSPLLVGRDVDLARLRTAIATVRTEARSVVLVSGEAGIGKSRLLGELERSTDTDPPGARRVRFLHATCIEVGERLAFLPILDWLAELGGDDGSIAAEAGDLHIAFGGAEAVGVPTEPTGSSRAARFGRLRDLLVHAALDRDVVAVVDDLHWADRSTLDVVTFLARRLGKTGVLLLAAYRSDELHRRHPLARPLAELERGSTLDHVRLEALDAVDVARQIAGIEGGPGDAARLARIVALADGNPFHVEELLALDRPGPLPSSLRDVLAARLAQVDDATIDVLREAAVIGRRVHPELLVAVSRVGRDGVDASLRVAMDARILVADEDGRRVRFRHALLREAVYDEVLPSDRLALHRRIAAALTDRPELGEPAPAAATADLARHWLAAGALTEAFVALLEAGRVAASVAAWAEARWALEEGLALWDRVPDAPELAGDRRSAVLSTASSQAWYEGDTRRALDLNRLAQAEPDIGADPAELGRLLVREAWYQSDLGEGGAAQTTLERAIVILPIDPPTRSRGLALGTLGARLAAEGRIADGIAMIEHAQTIALSMNDEAAAAGNLAFLAASYATLGLEDRAVMALADSRAALASDDAPWVEDSYFAFVTNVPWVWLDLGHYETTITVVESELADARRRGMEASLAVWFASPLAIALFQLGRWDEALTTIEESTVTLYPMGPECFMHAIRARILAARGAFDDARGAAGLAVHVARDGWTDEWIAARLAQAWTELLAGEPRAAADAIRTAVEQARDSDAATWRAETAWLAAWTAADIGSRGFRGDAGDELAAYARLAVDELGAGHPGGGRDGIDPWLDLAAAELARRVGHDEPARWAAVANRLDSIQNRPAAVIARLRLASAALERGADATAAHAALVAARAQAKAMGATQLEARAVELARAGRIRLEPVEGDGAPRDDRTRDDPWRLSGREREVLAMLIDGRTNAQIGAALFISDKTVSVHVTHILDKLGVSSRVEAALLAVRSGFTGSAGAGT